MPRGYVAQSVLEETLGLAAIGTLIGLAASLGAARTMETLLFQVSPNDPLTLAAVAIVLTATAVVAALVPARRAMRVDPIVALRTE